MDFILEPADRENWVEPGSLIGHDRRFYQFREFPIHTPGDADADGIDDLYELRNPFLDPAVPADIGIARVDAIAAFLAEGGVDVESASHLHVNIAWDDLADGLAPQSGSPLVMGVDAFSCIQAALDAAPDHAVIHVAPGVYESRLQITRPVLISGTVRSLPVNGESPAAVIRPATVSGNGALIDIAPAGEQAQPMRVALLDLHLDGSIARDRNFTPFVGIHTAAGTGLILENCLLGQIRPRAIGAQTGWALVAADTDLLVRNCRFDSWGKAAMHLFGDKRVDLIGNRFTGLDLSGVSQFSQDAVVMQDNVHGMLAHNRFENIGPSGQVNPAYGYTRVASDGSIGYAVDIRSAGDPRRKLHLRGNHFQEVQGILRDARRIAHGAPSDTLVTAGSLEGQGNLPGAWIAHGGPEDFYRIFSARADDPNLLNYAIAIFTPALQRDNVITLGGGQIHTLTRDLLNPPFPLTLQSAGPETVRIRIPNAEVPSRIIAGPGVTIERLPRVRFLVPAFQDVFPTNAPVPIEIETETYGRGLGHVSVQSADQLLGTLYEPPLTNLWANPTEGPHNLIARIEDAAGLRSESEPLPISIGQPTGILWEYWNDLPGRAILDDLLLSDRYPEQPDGALHLERFESPAARGSSYGARFRGYVLAPQSGQYRFWLTAHTQARLLLSTDEDPGNAVQIAAAQNNAPGTWQVQSAPVTLEAGQRYYIELLHKHDLGTQDHAAVGWRLPSGQDERPIPAEHLEPWIREPRSARIRSISRFNLYHILPGAADSDGDGLHDEEEQRVSRTDPEAANQLVLIAEIPGHAYSATTGPWTNRNEMAVSLAHAGALTFPIEIPARGMYRVVTEYTQAHPEPYNASLELDYAINGLYLGSETPEVGSGQLAQTAVYTPVLEPGINHFRINWWNVYPRMALGISRIRVYALEDAEEATEGDLPVWQQRRLARIAALGPVEATSLVSPASLEGYAAWPTLMDVTHVPAEGTTGTVTVTRSADLGWFAKIPLRADGSETPVSVSFQNGGLTVSTSLTWRVCNVLEAPDMQLRPGDSLRLSAFAPGTPPASPVGISINGQPLTATDSDSAIVHTFPAPGSYEITAQVDVGETQASGGFTVTVVQSAAPPAPVLWLGQTRSWDWPGIAPQASVDAGRSLTLELAATQQSTREYRLRSDHMHEYGAITARLGRNGPILHAVRPRVVDVQTAVLGYVRIVNVYPDGATEIENTLFIRNLDPAITIELRINTAGAIFGDGSISRILSAADFTETGALTYRVLRPAGNTTTCHNIIISQDGRNIGPWL